MTDWKYFEQIDEKGVAAVRGESPNVEIVEVVKIGDAVEVKHYRQRYFYRKSYRPCAKEVFFHELRSNLLRIDRMFEVERPTNRRENYI
jgi:hypothetical protein